MFKKESGGWIAEEKVWLTKDDKIVHDGDVRAATLLAPKGGVIGEKLAAKLKLESAKVEPLQKESVEVYHGYGGKTRAQAAKTVANQEIEQRSTRPVEVPKQR